MKISNFRFQKETDKTIYATVDVITGFWFWKKVTQRGVGKGKYSTYWKFVDTGDYTPDFKVELLYDAYILQQGFLNDTL